MANKTIPNLTAAGAATLADLIEVSQGGSSFKETLQQVKDLLQPYKVYRALLNQDGTPAVAPVPTVLENTIGAIVWSYDAGGQYSATLAGAFPAGKTFVSMSNIFVPAIFGTPTVGNWIQVGRVSNNVVGVQLYSDISIPALADAGLFDAGIEILVYP